MTDWLDDWAYRIPITIDHTKIDSDLTHFPVPIVLTGTDAETVAIELSEGAVTAKSVIIDIADNWGDGSYVGYRSVELFLEGALQNPVVGELTGYDTSTSFDPIHAFKDSVIQTGASTTSNGWTSNPGAITNQRTVVVFDTDVVFDVAVVNNYHHNGGATARGAKNVKIYISSDTITDTTYGAAISNSTLIFDGVLDQHAVVDGRDDQTLGLSVVIPKKIAVALPDKSQLYCEIEQWDTVNNKITLWTSRSDWVISSTEDTTIYLYYDGTKDDNTTYIGDTGGAAAQNVWDSNFAAVYHMAQDPSGGAGCILDSTSNTNHGTPNGSMVSGDLVDGILGKALDFDGIDDFIDCGDIASADGASSLTIETVITKKSHKDNASFVRKWTAGEQAFSFGELDNTNPNNCVFLINDTSQTNLLMASTTGEFLPIDTRKYVTAVWSGGDNMSILSGAVPSVIDYALETPPSPTSIANVSEHMSLGARYNLGTADMFADIILDEVRVSSIDRSAAWTKATNASLKNSLLTFSTIEEMPTYIFSGTVRVLGTTTSGVEVVLFHHPSNDLIGTDFSDSDGSFSINSTYDGTHYLVAFPPAETNYNAEIIYDIQST